MWYACTDTERTYCSTLRTLDYMYCTTCTIGDMNYLHTPGISTIRSTKNSWKTHQTSLPCILFYNLVLARGTACKYMAIFGLFGCANPAIRCLVVSNPSGVMSIGPIVAPVHSNPPCCCTLTSK